jgi:threonine/homoserine/homoserine lactone efflux protein
MPTPAALLLFLGASLALALTPGPDLLYITSRSAAEGRAAGVASVLGIALGLVVHTLAVSLGLAALLAAVPIAYEVVRYLGAAYLLYVGVRLLVRPARFDGEGGSASTRLRTVLAQGFLTNLLNPKVALFFLAFLPQFVDRAAGPVVPQILVLGLLFNVVGSSTNLVAALATSTGTAWLRSRQRPAAVLQRLAGGVFVALGVRLVLSER